MGQFNVTSDRLLLSPMSRHAAARDIHLCFAANTTVCSRYVFQALMTSTLVLLAADEGELQVRHYIEHDLLANDGCTTTTKQ